MQITHHHHTVPRLYLHAFAEAERKLTVRRRSQPGSTVGAKSATVEVDFYDPQLGPQPNDALETWLANKIESPGAPILEQMRLGQRPSSPDELRAAAAFVAFQLVRGRTFAHLNEQLGEVIGPLDFAPQITPRILERNPELTDADLLTIVELLRQKAPAHLAKSPPPRVSSSCCVWPTTSPPGWRRCTGTS